MTIAKFPRRRKSDGSVDSICPNCYLTIATAQNEDELVALEQGHVCASLAVEVMEIIELGVRERSA
jgi:hypothetical protein